jgi:hypothetical protein
LKEYSVYIQYTQSACYSLLAAKAFFAAAFRKGVQITNQNIISYRRLKSDTSFSKAKNYMADFTNYIFKFKNNSRFPYLSMQIYKVALL